MTGPAMIDAEQINGDVAVAALEQCERRAQALIGQGLDEDTAIAQAGDEAILVTRRVAQLARQGRALIDLANAYHGNTYPLLRDLGDHLGVSLAYVDRAIVDAHPERTPSDTEWAATSDQSTAMDFDDAVGDEGRFRTDWIETVLAKAGVPGYGYTTDGQPNTGTDEDMAGGAVA